MYNDELYHYGVKGMKWGVRKQRKVSAKYKKAVDRVGKDLKRDSTRIYVDAYNKATGKMNDGLTDKFNASYEKKYGKDAFYQDKYEDDYYKFYDSVFEKSYNEVRYDYLRNNANFKKAQALVNKYEMTKWDDLAKTKSAEIAELRKTVEGYKKQEKAERKAEIKDMFKKHPDLYDDFGGPDQIDDEEYFDLVLLEKGYK